MKANSAPKFRKKLASLPMADGSRTLGKGAEESVEVFIKVRGQNC
jgi:hypothetical protein